MMVFIYMLMHSCIASILANLYSYTYQFSVKESAAMSHVLKKLINGNKEFRKKYFHEKNTLYDELVQYGQKPKIMIIACCDSRVDPAMIFNCQPGELFVIRNVANLIPPCEDNDTSYHGVSAALEFGTCF